MPEAVTPTPSADPAMGDLIPLLDRLAQLGSDERPDPERLRLAASLLGGLTSIVVLTGWSEGEARQAIGCTTPDAEVWRAAPIERLYECDRFIEFAAVLAADARSPKTAQAVIALLGRIHGETGQDLNRTIEAFHNPDAGGVNARTHIQHDNIAAAESAAMAYRYLRPTTSMSAVGDPNQD